MKDLSFYQDCISELKNKKAFFILCDGYDSWSYGFPVSPICFSYDEYIALVKFIKAKFSFDIENTIINNNGWDCILPSEIESYLGKRICTFTSFPTFIKIENSIPTEQDWYNYLFKTDVEISNSIENKKIVMSKISMYTK